MKIDDGRSQGSSPSPEHKKFKMGAMYNPTLMDPRFQDQQKLMMSPAGVSTNYGINRRLDIIKQTDGLGDVNAIEATIPTALFAQGKGTGARVGGNVAKLRTPKNHMKSVRVPNSSSAMALPNPQKTPLLSRGISLRHAGESALNHYQMNSPISNNN